MHNAIIKNHRGTCSITYCNVDQSIEKIKNLSPDLLIIDKDLYSINKELVKQFLFIDKKIKLLPGEKTKTLNGVVSLLDQIVNLNIYPLNHVLVIGGATIQDTCATALALLKRGTKWTYIPTTLLAQADSCIGSKTSINSHNTKNLYGVFYSPQRIFIISEFLKSLPEIEVLSGIGDAMHYLLLDIDLNSKYILDLINDITENGIDKYIKNSQKILKLSSTVHSIKKHFIEVDEFDQSERKVLNLGHSFGHALEAFFEYKLPHGVAVLYGLVLAIEISINLFKYDNKGHYINSLKTIADKILEMLSNYSPIENKIIFNSIKNEKERYLNFLSRDKKNTKSNSFKLILFKSNKPRLVDCNKNLMIKFLENI